MEQFKQLGGQFLSSPTEIQKKLSDIRCILFDWDGVFNAGIKRHGGTGSPFSEPDSMGVNMLRFSHWLAHKELPFTGVITGANNLSAIGFAEREHLDVVLLNNKDKAATIARLALENNFALEEILFVFDDILDLKAAGLCGLSVCVRRAASPLLREFIVNRGGCDYITGMEGGAHAVREVAELLIGLRGNFEETVSQRMEYGAVYLEYLGLRQAIVTKVGGQ